MTSKALVSLLFLSFTLVDTEAIDCEGTFNPVQEFKADWRVRGSIVNFTITASRAGEFWAALGFSNVSLMVNVHILAL